MKAPEISRLNADAIRQEIRKKAPFYLPEWKAEVSEDVGFALSMIFSSMAGNISSRLNEAPNKHFLSFLEMLNFSLIPARSARVPLSFVLSEGAPGNAMVEASTRVSAKGSDGETVIFETEKNMLATPSKIVSVYSTIAKYDEIYDHSLAVDGKIQTELFAGQESLQEHILYIGDEELFNLKQGIIDIFFEGAERSSIKKLVDGKSALWEYPVELTEKKDGEDKKIKWVPFKSMEARDEGDAPAIRLEMGLVERKEDKEIFLPVTKLKVNGLESRWIRCGIRESKINEFKDLKVTNIKVSTSPSNIHVKKDSILKIQGIGDIYYSRLAGNQAEHGIRTISELLSLSDEELAGILRCSKIRAQNILEAARKKFYDKSGKDEPGNNNNTVKGIDPDLLFYNDIPLDISREKIQPFGSKPRLNDTFYIGSAEAFSKKGYKVRMEFGLEAGRSGSTAKTDSPQLSWEYWDGESWTILGVAGGNNNLSENGECPGRNSRESEKIVQSGIEIPEMPQIKPSRVNGKEGYWVRVRLVGGNYGKDYEINSDRNVSSGSFCPPVIQNLKINYLSSENKQPAIVLAKNNLEFRDCLKDLEGRKGFRPFEALPDKFPSVYFGFDGALKEGPMSLFIDIEESFEYPESFLPDVKWQYFAEGGEINGEESGGEWKRLEALDGTAGFTKKGMLQFVVPDKMQASSSFGSGEQYWIRALVTGNFFMKEVKSGSVSPAYAGFLKKERPDIYRLLDFRNSLLSETGGMEAIAQRKVPGTGECKKAFEVFNIDFQPEAARMLPPKVLGFYLNSVWAVQANTTYNEVIGSSSGEPGQEFSLIHMPVLDEEIWVNEYGSVSEKERKNLGKNIQEIEKDSEGNLKKFWVRWQRVNDFLESKETDRHYILDRMGGKIRFGNRIEGKVPPAGFENIKATYRSGGGKAGNIEAMKISKLMSSIAFVDRVYNPVPSEGGTDPEQTDALIKRSPAALKHRNRAMAVSDYEWLVREASSKVARVKVLPNFSSEGKFSTGWVTVVIVPEGTGKKPLPSGELKKSVKQYLEARCPPVLSLKVISPFYVRVDVIAQIQTRHIDAIPVIENKALEKITDFLHPLTGFEDGKGWNFGDAPCISDIYSILEGIEAVDYVEDVEIRYFEGSKVVTLTDTSVIKLPEYALPYSGEHSITVKWTNDNKEG
ncbi:putative baseplate assembly protein [Methanosarcina sp.]|uniref:putative baseplate assembly protein n=1 Tax=Methanosarcina sp. TaxID=2213 RepID=UPI002ABC24EE|nr:putative baseplate assembly protein [Methanosarcina sp.]MDY9927092.1 putative baseplate assembly protein [Methanosarcina sp.]